MSNRTCYLCNQIENDEDDDNEVHIRSCGVCTRDVCRKCSPNKKNPDDGGSKCCKDCFSTYENEKLIELKNQLNSDLLLDVDDYDILRFIRARKYNIPLSLDMIQKWHIWYTSPLPGSDVLPKYILDVISIDPNEHIYSDICPHLLRGEDKQGNPIYWEKTGIISSDFSRLKMAINSDINTLLIRHVRLQEQLLIRNQYQSIKHKKRIDKSIFIFDLKGLGMMPDRMGIDYVIKILSIDANYYPERLEKLIMINAPWFFSTIWSLISPWVDPVTAQKINILTGPSSYLPVLRELMNEDQIPNEIIYPDGGGTPENPSLIWHFPYPEESGISPQQLEAARIARFHSKPEDSSNDEK